MSKGEEDLRLQLQDAIDEHVQRALEPMLFGTAGLLGDVVREYEPHLFDQIAKFNGRDITTKDGARYRVVVDVLVTVEKYDDWFDGFPTAHGDPLGGLRRRLETRIARDEEGTRSDVVEPSQDA